MTGDLRDLYQTMILDHCKKPRNYGRPEHADRSAVGDNPICGDKITVYLGMDEEGVVREVGFEGAGCAISTASASLMTESIKGKRLEQVLALFERFHEVVTGSGDPDTAGLAKLAVFVGVRDFPMRVKCATLAWHTMRAALDQQRETVSTE